MSNRDAIRARYYNTDGTPVDLSSIEARLQKCFNNIDILSVEAVMDLYYAHTHFDKSESFKDWVRRVVPYSYSYAFDILKALDLLIRYKNIKECPDLLPDDVLADFYRIGIKRLKLISQGKDPQKKNDYMTRVLSGEILPYSELTGKRAVLILGKDFNLLQGGKPPAGANLCAVLPEKIVDNAGFQDEFLNLVRRYADGADLPDRPVR